MLWTSWPEDIFAPWDNIILPALCLRTVQLWGKCVVLWGPCSCSTHCLRTLSLWLTTARETRMRLGTWFNPRSQKIWIFFFLLKFNMTCKFWIVLMCWCQKWFLKNEKTSLTCILTQKVIWKAPATTMSNTLLRKLIKLGQKISQQCHDIQNNYAA
jgi:hypothetical protein